MPGSPLDLFPEVKPSAVQARLDYRRAHSGKTCERCRKDKPLSAFSRDSRNPDGLRRYCRECAATSYRSRRVNAH